MKMKSVLVDDEMQFRLDRAMHRCGISFEDLKYLCTGDNVRAISLLRSGKAKLAAASEDVALPDMHKPVDWSVDAEGTVTFTLVSNGMTPEQWTLHWGDRALIHWFAEATFLAISEPPTTGVHYRVAIKKDGTVEGEFHWELLCLICDEFTKNEFEQMGIRYFYIKHKPFLDHVGCPSFLYIDARQELGLWLSYENVKPEKIATPA